MGWCGTVRDSIRWYEMARDGWGMVWNGLRSYGMVWDGVGWYGMVYDGI